MSARQKRPVAASVLCLALMCAACGTSGSLGSSEEVCAFDGAAGTLHMRSGSSHADIWQDLALDLASGQLRGQVSSLEDGGARVEDVDETIATASLSALQERLRATCGELSSAEAPPDDMTGGSSALLVDSPRHGRFEVIGAGVNHTAAARTQVLEVSRQDYLRLTAAFPRPGGA